MHAQVHLAGLLTGQRHRFNQKENLVALQPVDELHQRPVLPGQARVHVDLGQLPGGVARDRLLRVLHPGQSHARFLLQLAQLSRYFRVTHRQPLMVELVRAHIGRVQLVVEPLQRLGLYLRQRQRSPLTAQRSLILALRLLPCDAHLHQQVEAHHAQHRDTGPNAGSPRSATPARVHAH